MEAISAVPAFVDTSLKVFDRLHASYKKHKHLPQNVESLRKDLRAIKEAIMTRSGTADQAGIHSWIADLKEIWQRIEDSVEFYNFKVTSDSNQPGWREYLLTRAQDAFAGPRKKLVKDIDDIKQLVAEANRRVINYQPPNLQLGETSSASREEQAYQHPKEAYPEGLGTATTDLVHTFSGANVKLMILAIVGPRGSGKSVLAEAAYNQVRRQEQFECHAWVTASHNANILFGNMLDELGFERPPPSKNLSQHLRGLLQGKRYGSI